MGGISDNRPALLSALCILTFAGSGLAFIAYFFASLLYEDVSQLIIQYSSWHTVEHISPLYFTLFMVFYAISLTGAIRMWKLHRDGYYLYVFAQIIILLLPVLWVNKEAFSVTNAIFTLVFISGYSINLGSLKKY